MSYKYIVLLVYVFIPSLALLSNVYLPFHVQNIPYDDRPIDPLMAEFHMTRYFGGCFHELKNEKYNQIVPWIRNFDLIITSCDMNWKNPLHSKLMESCAWVYESRNERINNIIKDAAFDYNYYRVHVHSDKMHQDHFFKLVFPYFESYRNLQRNFQYILHIGGGDSSVEQPYVDMILRSHSIVRWIVEQNHLEEATNHTKVLQLPIGLCARETYHDIGKELKNMFQEIGVSSFYLNDTSTQYQDLQVRRKPSHTAYADHSLALSNSADPTTHATTAVKMIIPWKNRLDRVYFCFHTMYPWRTEAVKFAQTGECTICDYCAHGSVNHTTLWHAYAKYKYVFSPHGNAPDCFRSWEIMIMGAIPLIAYFPGAYAYSQANLSIVLIHNITQDITLQNLTRWNERFVNHEHEGVKLTRRYWDERAFGGFTL